MENWFDEIGFQISIPQASLSVQFFELHMSNSDPKKSFHELQLSWQIFHFSTLCTKNQRARIESKKFSFPGTKGDKKLSWRLALISQRDDQNDDVYFDLCCNSVADLRKSCPVTGSISLLFFQPGFSRRIDMHGIATFRIASVDDSGLCGVRFRYNVNEITQMASQDKIYISCKLAYTREDFDPNSARIDKRVASLVESAECSLSRDLELFQTDEHFSDATISIKGKNYAVHKTILAARSSVFNVMFKNDMQESQKNHVIVTDIEQDVFEELLHYIYTGKITNLEESAFELFPVADKYDLKELKNACEGFLHEKLSAENAGKILVLADMHNAEDLKAYALRFIKENFTKFKDSEHAEMWNVFTESRPGLMKDMLAMFLKK